jgi:type II secretory pathway component GspD/PulD (secretin)
MRHRLYFLMTFVILLVRSLPTCAEGVYFASQGQLPLYNHAEKLEVPRVTLHLQNVSIQKAVDALFQGTGLEYQLDPDATGTVTVNLDNVPFDSALRIIARTAGLNVRHVYILTRDGHFAPARIEGGQPETLSPSGASLVKSELPSKRIDGFVSMGTAHTDQKPIDRSKQGAGISIHPAASPRIGERKFDVTLDQANLGEVIKQLMEISGQNYVFDLGVASNWSSAAMPKISARVRSASLDQVLDILAKSTGLMVTKNGDTYILKLPALQPTPGGVSGLHNVSPR